MLTRLRFCVPLFGISAVLSALIANGASAMTKSTWNGFVQEEVTVADRSCRVVLPNTAAPGRPWIWRTEFFGHEPQADIALLERGFHLGYMDVTNMFGGPPAMLLMDAFHAYMTTERGLAMKPVLIGLSRGGLFALNWAARHPEWVAGLYLDAPVCDFKSWPAGQGKYPGNPVEWERLKKVYGFVDDAEAMAYPLNPIDNLQPIAAAKIPILSVCGDVDQTVPFDENTAILEKRYRDLGGPIRVILKPGVGHHPHSLKDPQPIVDFVLASTGTPEARSLFDGTTLEGWEGDARWWRVEEGAITGGSLTETVPRNVFLATQESFHNFELQFKIRIRGSGGFINSGIQIRSVRVPGSTEMAGYQVDAGEGWWGKMYDESRRRKVIAESADAAGVIASIRKDDWNDYLIRAEGARIRSWINGIAALDYTEADPSIALDGLIGIQVHSGGKALIQVKDITLQHLAPTPGTPTWDQVGRPASR